MLSQIDSYLPDLLIDEDRITYVEPFVGGGAMLFHILSTKHSIARVIINDINRDLVECYKLIKDCPEKLIDQLRIFEHEYLSTSPEGQVAYYYQQRERYNASGVGRIKHAALFMFLNHTCFNGLFRVNTRGEFNVPSGKYKKPLICNEELIMADHEIMNTRDIIILCGDYKETLGHLAPKEAAFVYLDPPYMPISTTSYFKQYSSIPFGDKEQRELRAYCDELTDAGYCFMLSNSDCKTEEGTSYFEDLYRGYDCKQITARRYINAHCDKRGPLSEVLIRNYGGGEPLCLDYSVTM